MTSPSRPSPTSTGDMLERTRRRTEQMRRRRRAGLSAASLLVLAIAIGIPVALSGGGHHGHQVGVVGAPTVAPTTSVAIGPTSAPAGYAGTVPPTTFQITVPSASTLPKTPITTTPAAVATCATSQLRASLANGNGAAGSVGYDLLFVNQGSATCSLRGYPGVSYVTGAGATVGAPASRDAVGPVVTVDLAPGKSARATLIETDSHNYPPETCQLSTVTGVRVYPPNQTASLVIPQATQACANTADSILQIGPVAVA